MAGHGRGRISGGGVAGGLGSRQFHQHIHGGNELGRGGDRKLAVHRGQIDGHGGRLEGEGGWIVVRGWRIGRAGFHINSQGEVFTPDSEDEDAMEDVALEGATGMKVDAEGAAGMEVTANKAPGMEGAPGVELSSPRRCRRAWTRCLLASIQCTITSSSAFTKLWCPPSSNATRSSTFAMCSCGMMVCCL